jgi:UDP-N-acetylglucosamine 2-epimerase (non-hydrolysing)
MLIALEVEFERLRPDWVLVYGDTNSTLAAAIAAVKLGLPLAHLEAGLRSFNRRMPEEHNRVLTDHAADLCLAPTEVAMGHLADEGLADRSVHVGDVMTDVLMRVAQQVRDVPAILPAGIDGPFRVATIHRAENTDDPVRLRAIVDALAAAQQTVLLLAHPRLVASATAAGIELEHGALRVSLPRPYPELISLVLASTGVITDSGGLQKEAFLLRRPCVTLRTETEWVETVELGWNRLADPASGDLTPPPAPPTDATPYGDGAAAIRVADLLLG